MLQLEINEAKQKFRRLTEMPSREIAHRARERSYWKLERIGVGVKTAGAPYEHRDIQHIAVYSTGDSDMSVAAFRMQGRFFGCRW
jgi:hypothetical protein